MAGWDFVVLFLARVFVVVVGLVMALFPRPFAEIREEVDARGSTREADEVERAGWFVTFNRLLGVCFVLVGIVYVVELFVTPGAVGGSTDVTPTDVTPTPSAEPGSSTGGELTRPQIHWLSTWLAVISAGVVVFAGPVAKLSEMLDAIGSQTASVDVEPTDNHVRGWRLMGVFGLLVSLYLARHAVIAWVQDVAGGFV